MLPIFRSHYSIGSSILTLDPPEDEIKDNAPVSVFSIAKKHGLKNIFLCEKSMGGFVEAYKNAEKYGFNLRYGIEMFCCADMNDKSEASLKTEHKIQVWLKSTDSYSRFCKLVTAANTEGFYYVPRIDEKSLEGLLDANMSITIPFYDSFISQNLLTFGECAFDCAKFDPVFFLEKNNLPFEPIIEKGLSPYLEQYKSMKTKTVLYYKKEHIAAFLALKCKCNRSTFSRPNFDHFSSDEFCFESYLENVQ